MVWLKNWFEKIAGNLFTFSVLPWKSSFTTRGKLCQWIELTDWTDTAGLAPDAGIDFHSAYYFIAVIYFYSAQLLICCNFSIVYVIISVEVHTYIYIAWSIGAVFHCLSPLSSLQCLWHSALHSFHFLLFKWYAYYAGTVANKERVFWLIVIGNVCQSLSIL